MPCTTRGSRNTVKNIVSVADDSSSDEDVDLDEDISPIDEELLMESDDEERWSDATDSELDCSDDDDGVLYSLNPVDHYMSRDGKQEWKRSHPESARVRAMDILDKPAGVNASVGLAMISLKSAFDVFFTPNMKGLIVEHTNTEGRRNYGTSWKELGHQELDAFLGVLILQGVYRENTRPTSDLWGIRNGRMTYSAAISRSRFVQLLSSLRFDEKADREERRKTDKATHIRQLWEMFASICRCSYTPGEHVTVDETLVPFKGRCGFKQYMPNKPRSKYGIKVWMLCDSSNSYCSNMLLYTGKLASGQPEKHQGRRVTLELVTHLGVSSDRNVVTDNFFTDLELGKELLIRKVTLVGTLRKNKPEIPAEFLPNNKCELFSSLFGFTKDFTIVSYVPKKGKAVILLSSHHHTDATENTEAQKPEIITTYNATKAGVDTLDQRVGNYTCKRRTRRWPMALFYTIVDVALNNAFVIWTANNPSWKAKMPHKRRVFVEDVGHSLLTAHLKSRQKNQCLEKGLQEFIAKLLDEPGESVQSTPPTEKRKSDRCFLCPRKKDKKSSIACAICDKVICSDHRMTICGKCSQ